MKRTKRILAMFAAALMLFTAVPSFAFAEENIDPNGEPGVVTPLDNENPETNPGEKPGEPSGEQPGEQPGEPSGDKPDGDDPSVTPPEEDPVEPVLLYEGALLVDDTVNYDFDVKWNDNDDTTLRPVAEDYYNGGGYLQYRVKISDDEDATYEELTDEIMKQIGMYDEQKQETVPPVFDYSIEDTMWYGDVELPTGYYKVKYMDLDGDGALSEEEAAAAIAEAKKSEPIALHWLVINKHDSTPENYFVSSSETDPQRNKSSVTYTYETDYEAKIKWNDNGNIYNSRIPLSPEQVEIYQYEEGDVQKAVKLENVQVTLTDIDKDNVKVSLKELPAYSDEEGKRGIPFQYYVVLKAEGGKIEAANDTGEYKVLYENVDDFAQEEKALFQEGTLDLILQNTVDFTVKKVWKGKKDRPDCMLYLYRLAENEKGTIEDKGDIKNASPVQKYDNMGIPTDQDECFVTMMDGTEAASLPMYDSTGHRYIYFALERGVGNDYTSTINHQEAGDEEGATAASFSSKDVIDIFDENNSGNGSKYVLNRGVITNVRQGEANVQAGKFFVAKAMQNMNAVVEMTLQAQDAEGNWADAVDKDGNVIKETITGFSQESPGKTSAARKAPKYDAEGNRINYRWVETGIQIEDGAMIPVTYKETADGIIYNEFNENVEHQTSAPGIGDKKTTARFQPVQTADNVVKNILVGDTRVVIQKKWYKGGQNVSADQSQVGDSYAEFVVTRDGDPVSHVKMDGQDVFNSESEEGAYLTKDAAGEDCWEIIVTKNDADELLARYDAEGIEYLYDIKESGYSEGNWTPTYTAKRSVVTDEKGNDITQLQANVVNGEPGSELVFDIDKEWLDESDLETRKPVWVQVFSKDTNEPVSEAYRLADDNNWFDRIRVPANGKNVEDFYVKEVAIGEDGKTIPVTDTKSASEIQRIASQNVTGDARYADGRIIGNVKESGSCDKVHYEYDVFSTCSGVEKYAGNPKGRALYTVSNRRVALINLELVKEWEAGGLAPRCKFEVVRSSDSGEETVVTFDVDPEGVYNQNPATPKVKFEKSGSILGLIFNSKKQTVKVTIDNLPKYDAHGCQYEYKISEIGMYNNREQLVPFKNGFAKVDGDTFLSKMSSTVELQMHKNHHSGDLYKWSALNTRSASGDITAYKVWRDDGTAKNQKARPDIKFNLFRVSVSEAELADPGFDANAYCLQKGGEQVGGDKIWNTKWNDWCWSCDLSSLPRYDNDGQKYIYFLKEKYSGDRGEYFGMYSNKNANFQPNKSADVADTEAVFSVPNEQLYSAETNEFMGKGVLVLALGEDNDYSRTVVNAKKAERSVSGRKIWHLPDNWKLPEEYKPVIEIELYRSIKNLYEEPGVTASKIHEMIEEARAQQDYSVFQPVTDENGNILQDTLKSGHYSFKFDNLDKYDEYSRMYYYYPYEITKKSMYGPEVEASTDGHTLVLANTYKFVGPYVEVKVIKDWKKGDKKDNLRPAEFVLYVEQTDDKGKPIESTKVKVATKYVDAMDVGRNYVVFDETVQDGKKVKLPYYGPNENPLHYIVKENLANGYNSRIKNVDGTSLEIDVPLTEKTDEEGNKSYEGMVNYENQYDGGKTSIKVQKAWETYGYDAYLMTSGIKVKIKRSWTKQTVNGKEMPAGEEYVYVDAEGNPKDTVLNKDNNWTFEDKELQKYAPNGSAYTYFIEKNSEQYVDYSDLMKTFFVGSASGTKYTNTLKTDKVEVTKNWTDQDGTKITAAQMAEFVNMGLMPEKMYFTLYRYTTDRESASEVGDYSYKNGNTPVKVKGKQEKLTKDAVNGAKVASWDKLPKYDLSGNEYTYIVKEEVGNLVFWSDSTDEPSIQKIMNGLVGATPSATTTSSTSGAVTTTKVAFTNKLELDKIYLKKVWDDKDNFDDTRPADINFYIALKTTPASYKTVPLPHKSGNEWTSDAIKIPKIDGTEAAVQQYLEGALIVTEDEIKTGKYKAQTEKWQKESYDDGSYIWFKKIVNSNHGPDPWSRLATNILGQKFFEDDGDWTDVTRPQICLAVYYKDRTSGSWTPLTAKKAQELYNIDANSEKGKTDEQKQFGLVTDLSKYSIVKTPDASNNWEVSWEGMVYTHWYLNSDPGVPEAVEYRLFEVEPGYVDNTLNGGADPVIVDNDPDFPYIVKYENKSKPDVLGDYVGAFTNTLKTTELSVKKTWNDSDNVSVRPDEIKVKLVAKHADGSAVDGFVEVTKSLNKDNRWSTKFEGLPMFDKSSKKIVYSVAEVVPEDLKKHYDMGEPVKTSETSYEFEITNTLKPIPVEFNKVKLINESCDEDPEATAPFAGVKFKVTAPDNTTSEYVSDTNGKVKFEVQMEGKYLIEEIEAEAPYLLDGNVYSFTIDKHSWDGKIKLEEGTYPEHFDADTNTIINDQVRGDFEFLKADAECVEDEEGNPEDLLAGAVFGLYDKEGKKIAEATSNDKGVVKFEGLITDKEYTVKELVAPLGYYISKYPIVVKLNNENGEAKLQIIDDGHGTIEVSGTTAKIRWNDPAVDLNIVKVDPSGNNLAGAVLQVRDKSGRVITEWETSGDEDGDFIYMANKLKVGETYYLHEVKAPKGYKIAKDVAFTVPNVKVGPEEDKVIKIKMVDPKIPDTPKTGDDFNIMFWAMLMILSLMGIGGAIAVPRLRRRS